MYFVINLIFNLEIKICDWVDDLRLISLMICVSVDDLVSFMNWVWLFTNNEFKDLSKCL